MKIKEFIEGKGQYLFFVEGESGKTYLVRYDRDTGRAYCNCPAFFFNNTMNSKDIYLCKHIKFVVLNYDLKRREEKMDYIPTGCKTLDNIIGGGVPKRAIVGFFAKYHTGKTFLTTQIAHSYLEIEGEEKKKKALIIETEGEPSAFYEYMGRKYQERFGNTTFPEVRVARGIKSFFALFGKDIDVVHSTSGTKMTVHIKDMDRRKSYMKLEKYGILIIDSFTKPFEVFGSAQQNLPARSDAQNPIFEALQVISEDYNMPVILTHHATASPVPTFSGAIDLGEPKGGSNIWYNTKYIIGILDGTKPLREKYGDEVRRFYLVRHPYKRVSDAMYPVLFKEDYGFTDVK